jgi:hypothetical protein
MDNGILVALLSRNSRVYVLDGTGNVWTFGGSSVGTYPAGGAGAEIVATSARDDEGMRLYG